MAELLRQKPLVSIVVPAFNAADTIERTVESVLAQTYQNLEVIVVDDKSEDDTVEVIAELSARDHRVRPIPKDRNSGVGATCNVGLASVRGEWVAIVDSDDALAPNRLEVMLRAAQDSGASMIFDNLLEIPIGKSVEKGRSLVPQDSGLFGELPLETFAMSISSISALPNLGYLRPLFARALIAESSARFDEQLRVGEDSLFYCELYASGGRGVLIPEHGYFYFRRDGSLSSEFGSDRIEAMRDAFAGLKSRSESSLTPNEIAALGAVVEDLDHRLNAKRVFGDLKPANLRDASRRFLKQSPERIYLYREFRHRVRRALSA